MGHRRQESMAMGILRMEGGDGLDRSSRTGVQPLLISVDVPN